MSKRDELIDWLRDAYAMERGLEVTLRKQSESEELTAAARERARQHLDETRHHAEAVKTCIEQLGADTSSLKTSLAQVTESLKGMGTAFARDERVKDVLAAYASENFEIACYKALRVAADLAGEPSVIAVCDRIIPEEEAMARWLDNNLPDVVGGYLAEQGSHREHAPV
jgi:ferritin-like metal-binding protein YciE